MKIALPNDSKQSLGGAWTFRRNLILGLERLGQEIVDDYTQADIALVSAPTVVTKETIYAIRDSKAKLVLRLDNVPRNSRNRNVGTFRLHNFSQIADTVVWQSQWAKDYLFDFVKRDGPIIYNGANPMFFSPSGATLDFHTEKKDLYLYSRFNRDETKNWEVAWYEFQLIARKNPNAKLVIVGKFSEELVEYNFDFFRGEKIEFLGIIDDPTRMSQVMRSCGNFLATYFNDCFSNTYLEALLCGMELYHANMSGGTPEMLDLWNKKGAIYFMLDRMAQDYIELFTELLS